MVGRGGCGYYDVSSRRERVEGQLRGLSLSTFGLMRWIAALAG